MGDGLFSCPFAAGTLEWGMVPLFCRCCALVLGLASLASGELVQVVEGLPQHAVPEVAAAVAEGVPARHVILMIGDGMGSEHLWAAWACNGGRLHMERLSVCGWSRTSSASHAVTDSAAGGTAIACGERTSNGTVGQAADGRPLESIAARLKGQGYATGLVVTKSITDATPASFYAHAASRYDTPRIASQLPQAGFAVLLGGGAADVGEQNTQCLRDSGALVELSAPHDLPPATRRGDYLPRAVERALTCLGEGDRPFFLMVEGSQVDVAAHARDLREVVAEVLEFDRALGSVLRWAESHPDALIIVLADHQTGGLSLHDADPAAGRVGGSFSTNKHTGFAVPVYAAGAGALNFAGIYDNRSIFARLLRAVAPSPGSRK